MLTQKRVMCRVLPEAVRLCFKACVGVLLHATPQLSFTSCFIRRCMQVLHSSATLEVANAPSPIQSTSTQVLLLLLYSISSLYADVISLSKVLFSWSKLGFFLYLEVVSGRAAEQDQVGSLNISRSPGPQHIRLSQVPPADRYILQSVETYTPA